VVDDNYHGIWEGWYKGSGRRSYSRTYVEGGGGMLEGPYQLWYDNEDNTTEAIGYYVRGKKEGLWTTYDENGTIIFNGNYINNVKQ
jgi:antitoxin component YwqK of YwqJK toxin-antitoxin module